MKKVLLMLFLAAAPACLQAQRIMENTNNSWLLPNLSVETYKDLVFAGCTDRNPATGFNSPYIKVTNINGPAITSYYLDLGADVYLMDFTIRPNTETILLTGFRDMVPYNLFVIETDLWGNMIQAYMHNTASGSNMTPHQITYSENMQQAAIVGTEINGTLTSGNYASVSKSGFVLGLDLNNLGNILFTQEMDTPPCFSTDNDMLENITETPAGYFISGSANNASWNEQNLYTLGIDFAGNTMFSDIWDNTNYRYAGASVMYSSYWNVVYVLANSSVSHQFQVAQFDWNTGLMLTNFHRHQITSLPIGSGVDQNGFRLQETNNHDILVGGYLAAWNTFSLPNIFTPFQATLDPTLANVLTFKMFQSDNNYNSGDYFSMFGNSTYINTPDVIAFNTDFNRTVLVNPNSNMGGFDINYSMAYDFRECEEWLPSSPYSNMPPSLGPTNNPQIPVIANNIWENPMDKKVKESILCMPKNRITEETTFEAELFPNPAKDQLTVKTEVALRSLKVTDMNGALVQAIAISGSETNEYGLSISGLNTGVYLIEMENTDGTISHTRFVKE